MSARYRAYIYILIAIILWGIAGPVIKYTLGYFDTITFLTIRFGLTSLILVPFWIWTERHKKHLFPDLTYKDWTVLIVLWSYGHNNRIGIIIFGICSHFCNRSHIDFFNCTDTHCSGRILFFERTYYQKGTSRNVCGFCRYDYRSIRSDIRKYCRQLICHVGKFSKNSRSCFNEKAIAP